MVRYLMTVLMLAALQIIVSISWSWIPDMLGCMIVVLDLYIRIQICDLLILYILVRGTSDTKSNILVRLYGTIVSDDTWLGRKKKHYYRYYKVGRRVRDTVVPLLLLMEELVILQLRLLSSIRYNLSWDYLKQVYQCIRTCMWVLRILFWYFRYRYMHMILGDLNRLSRKAGYKRRFMLRTRKPWLVISVVEWYRATHRYVQLREYLSRFSYSFNTLPRRIYYTMFYSRVCRFVRWWYVVLTQRYLNRRIDWYRIHYRVYKSIRNRIWYPIADKYWWPILSVYMYYKWRSMYMKSIGEENICRYRKPGEQQYCECYYQRTIRRREGYPDMIYEGIKIKRVPDVVQLEYLRDTLESIEQYSKEYTRIEIERSKYVGSSFLLVDYRPEDVRRDTRCLHNMRAVDSEASVWNRCYKVWKHTDEYDLPLTVRTGQLVYGPLTREMMECGHPPYLEIRNDTCKALVVIPKKVSLYQRMLEYIDGWLIKPEREDWIYKELARKYPGLTREEYDRICAYSIANVYRIIVHWLTGKNAWMNLLHILRGPDELATPIFPKPYTGKKRKKWKRDAHLDKSYWRVPDKVSSIAWNRGWDRTKNLLSRYEYYPGEYNKVLSSILCYIKSYTEQAGRSGSHGNGDSSASSTTSS